NGVAVGKATYSSLATANLEYYLVSAREIDMVKTLRDQGEFAHLKHVEVKSNFRAGGIFRDTVKQFEELYKGSRFKGVTVDVPEQFLKFFESVGYERVGYLDSIGNYLMKKDLV
ncbi:hypothetical protein, partial [Lysinibacillus xylanilyticus]|uniref:hypothetical protein n=1 Tax=Lysinibacillus xylanilyticus TaxID=582475 RepID=UPI0036D9B9BA